jgi:phytanoyl-CoA hydroxylase
MNTVDREHFDREGYFVAQELLDPQTDLEPLKQEYSGLLDRLAQQWHKEGKVSSTYSGLTFSERVCKFTSEGQDCSRYFDIVLPSNATADTPIHLGPAIFQLLRNLRLLDALEQLIGAEIYCNPVQHIRIKPPEKIVPQGMLNGLNSAVGWHQDMGVVNPEADETTMISVWIPVLDATVDNGCLQVVPGSHRGALAVHCNYGEGQKKRYLGVNIPDQLVPPNHRPIPMKAGDVLFFHKKLMHSSLPNQTDGIRWSFDLRYNPIGQPSGREWLPGFIARSKSHPEMELKDPAKWADLWIEARARLATGGGVKPSSRWDSNNPLCA